MKADYLLHNLKSHCLVLQSQLGSFPEPRTKKEKQALQLAIERMSMIKEAVDAIRAAQQDELISNSIISNQLNLVWLDDNVDEYGAYIEELEQYGIDIFPISDGQEALDYIREHRVDGALVDLQMPDGISGLDFINATEGQIPCIAVSSYLYNSELQRTAITRGAVGVLDKNFDAPGSNAAFAKSVLGFFSEERRFKALEDEVLRNPGKLDAKVSEILASLDELPEDTKDQIAPYLQEISTELSKSDPDIRKISAAGSAASNIAQGAAGNLAANGVLHLLGALF